jgi:hypothetical protein
MKNVKMTREQFERADAYRRDIIPFETVIHRIANKSWVAKENKCLNELTPIEFATAWIAPEKVEIVEPEITWQEAIQHVLNGGEVLSFDVNEMNDRIVSLESLNNFFLGDRIQTGKWRKVESK